jgi:hypothetical protein
VLRKEASVKNFAVCQKHSHHGTKTGFSDLENASDRPIFSSSHIPLASHVYRRSCRYKRSFRKKIAGQMRLSTAIARRALAWPVFSAQAPAAWNKTRGSPMVTCLFHVGHMHRAHVALFATNANAPQRYSVWIMLPFFMLDVVLQAKPRD